MHKLMWLLFWCLFGLMIEPNRPSLFGVSKVYAHSGGLDSSGCHGGSRPYHCHRSQSEMVGNRLRCDLGSKSKDCKPEPPSTQGYVPDNAIVSGNDWYCKRGYRRNYQTNRCDLINADKPAQIPYTSSSGYRSYSYDVDGYGDGQYVSGYIDSSGAKSVDGYIQLESGEEVYFEGEWVAKGVVEGYDENGNYYELEVN